jgi:UDP-4-amino-4,6-dideoxy-N-acetyl-beta-L-altrosamine transaminase
MKETSIPYGRQWLDSGDVTAVTDALRSDRLTQGSEVEAFERDLAACCGARFAVAVSSGTAALHLACLALDAAGEVVTSPLSFIGTANSVIHAGGRPVFADIDPRTYNLDPDGLEKLLSEHPAPDKVCGVIPVHFAGYPCDLESIREIARRRNLFVLEDGCHALGATRRSGPTEQRVGDCTWSDATVFSFHPVKHVTTGEGGAVVTNREDVAERCRRLRHHGISRSIPGAPSWYYEMNELGFNYRITDFQCALGRSQLRKLDGFIAARRQIALQYDEAFRGMPEVRTPNVEGGVGHAYHLYVVQVPDRDRVFDILRERGIGVQVHYLPIHLQPYYQKNFGYGLGDLPEAERYLDGALSLPLYPAMTDEEVRRVIAEVARALGETAK